MASEAFNKLRHVSFTRNVNPIQSDLFDHFQSLLVVLLNETKKTSSFHFRQCHMLFPQLLPLYRGCPQETLRFSVSVISELFKTRLSRLLIDYSDISEEIVSWEEVIRMILNGIRDYIESDEADLSCVGREVYKPLFDILVSPLGLKLGARVRTQAFGLLSDAAERNKKNKELLKRPSVLGGIRLGHLIAATNEYLALDCLFQLLARLTPSSHDPNARSVLAKQVFQNPKVQKKFGARCCKDLCRVLQNSTGDKWEQATDEMICVLAKADPSKPQPFLLATNEIHANSISMHHPAFLNKCYLDNTEILVNLLDEDGIDCLQVAYKSITSIQFQSNHNVEPGQGVVQVVVNLSLPPIKGDEPIPYSLNGNNISFTIARSELSSFRSALSTRGLDSKVSDVEQSCCNVKRSIVSGPLNLNDVGATSFEIKSKELESFCATSPIDPDQVNYPDSIFIVDALDNTPEKTTVMDTSKIKSSEPAYPHGLKTVQDHENIQIDPPKLSNLSDHLGLKEPLSDAESLPPAEAIMTSKIFSQKLKKSFPLDEEELGTPAKPDSRSQNPLPDVSNHPKRSRKRKMNEGIGPPNADEGIKEDKLEAKPPCNSQFLNSPENIAKRATSKYKARPKRPSPFPRESMNDNFDSVPGVVLAAGPNTHTKEAKASMSPTKPQPRKRGRKPLPIKNNKAAKKTEKTKTKVNEQEAMAESDSTATHRSKRPKGTKVMDRDENYPTIKVADAKAKGISTVVFGTESPSNLSELATSAEQPGGEPLRSFRSCNINVDKGPLVVSCQTSPSFAGDQSKVLEVFNAHDKSIISRSKLQVLSCNLEIPGQLLLRSVTKDQLDQSHASVTTMDSAATDITEVGIEDFAMDIDALDIFAAVQVASAPVAPVKCSSVMSIKESGTANSGVLQPAQQTRQSADPSKDDISTEFRKAPVSDACQPDTISFRHGALYNETSHVTQNPQLLFNEKTDSKVQNAIVNHDVVDLVATSSIAPNSILKENRSELSPQKTKSRLSVSFAKGTKDSPTFARPLWANRLGKCDAPSRIPRLSSTRATLSRSYGPKTPSQACTVDKYDISEASRTLFRTRRLKAISQHLDSSDDSSGSSDEDSAKKLNTDGQIVIVLNQIHEVILRNLHRKFDAAAAEAQRISRDLKKLAAEDVQEMLIASVQHRQNMLQLEKKYADFGRALKTRFESFVDVNESIGKRLQQAIVDHDRDSVVKKVPKKLADRPKIMQRLLK